MFSTTLTAASYLSGSEQRLIDLLLQLSVVIELSFLQSVQPPLLLVHRRAQHGI